MFRLKIAFFIKYILLLLILTSSRAAIAQETIRIATGEWPPYLSEQLPYQGFIARIVKSAFALEGIEVEYGFFPWKRSLKLSMEGDWDGSAAWFFSAERTQSHYYSDAVFTTKTYFFHLKERPFEWDSITDLYRLNIGIYLDTFISAEFEQAEKTGQINVEGATSFSILIKKLIAGRIDAITMELEHGYTLMQQELNANQYKQIKHHKKPIASNKLYVIFSKKIKNSLKMRAAFNKGLQQLKASGQYDKYYQEQHDKNAGPYRRAK